jgi:hypothetical protein
MTRLIILLIALLALLHITTEVATAGLLVATGLAGVLGLSWRRQHA